MEIYSKYYHKSILFPKLLLSFFIMWIFKMVGFVNKIIIYEKVPGYDRN